MSEATTSKDRIKREAMRLFVKHGTDAVSMRDIADAVGMKAPSLYAHFRGRDELIAALFHASYSDYGQKLAQAAATAGHAHGQLKAMVQTICALHAQDELLFNFLLLTQHGFLAEIPADDRNPVEVICRWVAASIQSGDIPPGNPTLIAGAIMGVIIQNATFRMYGRLTTGLNEHAEELYALCLRIVS